MDATAAGYYMAEANKESTINSPADIHGSYATLMENKGQRRLGEMAPAARPFASALLIVPTSTSHSRPTSDLFFVVLERKTSQNYKKAEDQIL